MNPTISDLWYGNICELEACGSLPHILRKENLLSAKVEDLRKTLAEDQKQLLEQLLEAMYDNSADYAAAAFERGFCLAARLMGEVWTCQTP